MNGHPWIFKKVNRYKQRLQISCRRCDGTGHLDLNYPCPMPPHLPIKGFSTFIAFNSCARRALGIQNRPFRLYQSRCLHLKPLPIPSIRVGDKVCQPSLIYEEFIHCFKASAPRNCPLCCFAQKSLRCFGNQAGCNTRWNQENLLRSPYIFLFYLNLYSESQSLHGNTTLTRTRIRVQEINS